MLPDFLIPFIVGFITQSIKISFDIIKNKKFNIDDIRSSGGFPSVHSSLSSSVSTLIALKYGINSDLFLISIVFSFILRYDAMNIRYEAGKHAQLLKNYFQEKIKYNLKERLGHTFIEVIAGIIAGFSLTIILYYL